MEPTLPIKDYIDARDDAVESRINARLDQLPTTEAVRNNIWGAAITVIGLLLGVAAFAGDRFDGGLNASSILEANQKAQAEIDKGQDAKLELMDQKLDILIKQTAEK